MNAPQILVVEDEAIVARNIQTTLERGGYAVPAVVATGEDAIQQATLLRPDLVLMDINLRGDMLGVEAAAEIQSRLGIPIVYLTAYADSTTLEQAQLSEPLGYLVKPFRPDELCTTIYMALYKHKLDQKLKESESRYRAVSELTSDFAYCLRVEPDGTLVPEWVTDAFERITGYSPPTATRVGRLGTLVHPEDLMIAQAHLKTVLDGQADVCEVRIVGQDGQVRWLRNHSRPEWDGEQERAVRIFAAAQDITVQKQAQEAQEELIAELQEALSRVKTLSGLLPICASCKKIRNDSGYWTAVEVYLMEHSDAIFSHGICPGCAQELYPGFYESQ